LGSYAGHSSTGNRNIFLGNNAGYFETGSDKLFIDNSDTSSPLIYGEFDNDIVRINSTLQIGDPSGTGYAFPIGRGTTGQILTTQGNGTTSWVSSTGTGSQKIDDLSDAKSDNDGSNNGSSIFFGVDAGSSDNSSDNQNVGLGFEALKDNTSGKNNSANGYQALMDNSIGNDNTAIGYRALNNNTNGAMNVALGHTALSANRNDSCSVAVGYGAMQMAYFTTGGQGKKTANTAIGYYALRGSSWPPFNSGQFNTSIGFESLLNNSRGDHNTGIGNKVLHANTEGDDNTANGNMSLYSNTVGNNNTAIGSEVLSTNVAGSNATAIGYNAMKYVDNTSTEYSIESVSVGYEALRGSTTASNNTGRDNTAIGYQTLKPNTTGSWNTAAGHQVLVSNTEGTSNSAFGNGAMYSNITGNENIAFGLGSLYSNQAGSSGTAIGCRAMQFFNNSTTAFTNYNVALGYEALRGQFLNADNNTGNKNTAIGYQSLWVNTTGDDNTVVGHEALKSNTTGNRNTVLGYNSGNGIVTGNNNTIIGAQVTGLSSDLDNNIIIADGEGHQRIRVTENGYVGIGTSTAEAKLHVYHAGTAEPITVFEATDDVSLLINGQGGESYIEFQNDNTTTTHSWKMGMNDENRLDIQYGQANSMNSNTLGISVLTDGRVGVGTNTPASSAVLEVNSSTKGFLPPRMTTSQINAINSPVEGLIIYDTDRHRMYYYNGTLWKTMAEDWSCGDQIADADDNAYSTIQLGTQCWMAENLNVGTMINTISYQTNNSSVERYCYNNEVANCDTMGGLYNWDEMMQYVTTEGAQGICPSGWHIPSDDEFKTLEMHLGLSQAQADGTAYRGTNEGSKLAGNASLWTDGILEIESHFGSSGFNALPGGYKQLNNVTRDHWDEGYFWTSTESLSSFAWFRSLNYNVTQSYRYYEQRQLSYSVRCVKD